MMQLENILEMPNKIEDFLNLYKKNKDMPVILFGGGKWVYLVYKIYE